LVDLCGAESNSTLSVVVCQHEWLAHAGLAHEVEPLRLCY